MANTWIATSIYTEDRVAQFRSDDFDPLELSDEHGAVAIYDLTDEMRPIGFVDADGAFLPAERQT